MPKISDLASSTTLTDDDYLLLVNDPSGTPATKKITAANAAIYFGAVVPPLEYALSDETTSLTTGTKIVVRAPYDLTLDEVRASLTTESSSGAVSVDIEVDGDSILSTELTVDANERTSVTATPAVIGATYLAEDAEVAFVVTGAGTGAKGLKVKLYHTLGGTPPASDIAFVASTNTTYTSRTNTTVTKPTGTANGDLVLLGILTGSAGGNAPDPTPPAGFTLLTGFPITATDGAFTIETRIYHRIAASEGADWTFTHTSASSQGFALTYTGVDATTPIDVNPSTNQGTGSTTTATGITTVTNNAMVVYVAHDWGDTANPLTAPTGTTPTFIERIDTTVVYAADGLLATAGATGNKTQTSNSGVSGAWGATLIALRPA